MLTADLVHVRRRGDKLQVVPLADNLRPRALELASFYLTMAKAHLDSTRGDLLEACQGMALAPQEMRLGKGLLKLVLDACTFEETASSEAQKLRSTLFSLATQVRRNEAGAFNRDSVLKTCAHTLGFTPADIEQGLYADLPEAQRLRHATLPTADILLTEYELAQQKAVLLRAVRLKARVHAETPDRYRTLFRQLKFHRLLYSIVPLERESGYEITLDGPMSLFEQTTKYGLRLSLALPTLWSFDTWSIEADVLWGKDRSPLRYRERGEGRTFPASPELPDEIATLLAELQNVPSPWQIRSAEGLLDSPGMGICIPDLEFIHRTTGRRIFLEVLGYWSRDAVWKRVELAQKGLPHPILFAVGKHLRVSEEALPHGLQAALYVFGRTLDARSVLKHIDRLNQG